MLAIIFPIVVALIAIVGLIIVFEVLYDDSLASKYGTYKVSKDIEDCAVISFEQFESYYYLNPEAYRDGQTQKIGLFDAHRSCGYLTYQHDAEAAERINIVFSSFSSFLKYLHFVNKKNKQTDIQKEKELVENQKISTIRYYNHVLNDIEKLKGRANEEILTAVNVHEEAQDCCRLL